MADGFNPKVNVVPSVGAFVRNVARISAPESKAEKEVLDKFGDESFQAEVTQSLGRIERRVGTKDVDARIGPIDDEKDAHKDLGLDSLKRIDRNLDEVNENLDELVEVGKKPSRIKQIAGAVGSKLTKPMSGAKSMLHEAAGNPMDILSRLKDPTEWSQAVGQGILGKSAYRFANKHLGIDDKVEGAVGKVRGAFTRKETDDKGNLTEYGKSMLKKRTKNDLIAQSRTVMRDPKVLTHMQGATSKILGADVKKVGGITDLIGTIGPMISGLVPGMVGALSGLPGLLAGVVGKALPLVGVAVAAAWSAKQVKEAIVAAWDYKSAMDDQATKKKAAEDATAKALKAKGYSDDEIKRILDSDAEATRRTIKNQRNQFGSMPDYTDKNVASGMKRAEVTGGQVTSEVIKSHGLKSTSGAPAQGMLQESRDKKNNEDLAKAIKDQISGILTPQAPIIIPQPRLPGVKQVTTITPPAPFTRAKGGQ